MTYFEVHIETDNEAFSPENRAAEVARLLRAAADRVERETIDDYGVLRDTNGNRVGFARFVANRKKRVIRHGKEIHVETHASV